MNENRKHKTESVVDRLGSRLNIIEFTEQGKNRRYPKRRVESFFLYFLLLYKNGQFSLKLMYVDVCLKEEWRSTDNDRITRTDRQYTDGLGQNTRTDTDKQNSDELGQIKLGRKSKDNKP